MRPSDRASSAVLGVRQGSMLLLRGVVAVAACMQPRLARAGVCGSCVLGVGWTGAAARCCYVFGATFVGVLAVVCVCVWVMGRSACADILTLLLRGVQ